MPPTVLGRGARAPRRASLAGRIVSFVLLRSAHDRGRCGDRSNTATVESETIIERGNNGKLAFVLDCVAAGPTACWTRVCHGLLVVGCCVFRARHARPVDNDRCTMSIEPVDVDEAIRRLKLLHDDLALLDVIACGEQAIPALRKMLLKPERGERYEVRCRAVAVLAALGAHSVLIEYLESEHSITDPIEQMDEDAVINAAALALANVRKPHVLEVLRRLARRPALTGVIGALGALGGADDIPVLVGALEEDASRLTAENALRKLGKAARTALLHAVDVKVPSAGFESESSARRRRSAVRLLTNMDKSLRAWRDLRHLVEDKDARVAAIACETGLPRAPQTERRWIVRRLIQLLGVEDWMLREEIVRCLATHVDSARDEINARLSEISQAPHKLPSEAQTEAILYRILSRSPSTQRER